MSWNFPKNNIANQRVAHIGEANRQEAIVKAREETLKIGQSLMLKRVLFEVVKEIHEPKRRRSLFRMVCECKGKCCKLIIIYVTNDNLVSIEMVEKLDCRGWYILLLVVDPCCRTDIKFW